MFKICIFLLFAISALGNECIDKLHRRMTDSLVCIGLDPDWEKLPLEIRGRGSNLEERIFSFLKEVIDLTAEHACAFKIQKAFYDSFDKGPALLRDTVSYLKENHSDVPVFIDCKIGDIDNTMNAYIHNLFELIGADGVVINPYMGDDVFQPFFDDPEKVAIVLVQTSNPQAKVVQELKLDSGEFLWERVLDLTLSRWNRKGNLIPVLSSNAETSDFKAIRREIPQETPILLAGIGAQGGNLSLIRDLLNEQKSGVFVNSSRGILYPYSPDESDWREAIRQAAIKLKDQINRVRYAID